jgi:hypothetical protein
VFLIDDIDMLRLYALVELTGTLQDYGGTSEDVNSASEFQIMREGPRADGFLTSSQLKNPV